MNELDIGQRADTRIAEPLGGQRKRVSVALELLTTPALLFLDEPTSGLDPGNERELMSLLRGLATKGRMVVVVTHSTQSLDLCDRLLVLAPGGKLAYYGPPSELDDYFGEQADDAGYARLFEELEEGAAIDWKGRFRGDPRYEEYVRESLPSPRPLAAGSAVPPPLQSPARQFCVLARRQLSLIAADRRTTLFLAIQPVVLALLFLLVFHTDVFTTREGFRGVQLLWLLVVGVTWMGLASTILEVVKETSIYRRERGVGLSVGAYLGSKAAEFGAISMVQAVALTLLVLVVQQMPPRDDLCSDPSPDGRECFLDVLASEGYNVHPLGSGALLSSASVELTLDLMVVALAAAMLGLLVSTLAKTFGSGPALSAHRSRGADRALPARQWRAGGGAPRYPGERALGDGCSGVDDGGRRAPDAVPHGECDRPVLHGVVLPPGERRGAAAKGQGGLRSGHRASEGLRLGTRGRRLARGHDHGAVARGRVARGLVVRPPPPRLGRGPATGTTRARSSP